MPISEEYRVFAYAGQIMFIDDYWRTDQKVSFSDEERHWIEAAVKKIKSNFVTLDIARRKDGKLIIVELGDGQVSGLQQIIFSISTTQELVDAYVSVHNKFWFIEDDLYDYEEGTEEYERVRGTVDAWGDMMDELDKRVMETAAEEGLLAERQPNSGTVKQLEAFMDKHGYRDGRGWWVKK